MHARAVVAQAAVEVDLEPLMPPDTAPNGDQDRITVTAAVPVCGITTRHNHSSFDDPIDCAWRDRKPTWHSDIVRAGLVGLHRVPWWECDDRDEQPCRDTVYAVLTGLADAGYRLMAQDQPHSSDAP